MEVQYSGLLIQAALSVGFTEPTEIKGEQAILIKKEAGRPFKKWDPMVNNRDCEDIVCNLGEVFFSYRREKPTNVIGLSDKVNSVMVVSAKVDDVMCREWYRLDPKSKRPREAAKRKVVVRLAATIYANQKATELREKYRKEEAAKTAEEAEKKRIRDEKAQVKYEQGYLTPEERRIVIDSAVEAKRLNKISESIYMLTKLKDYTPSLV